MKLSVQQIGGVSVLNIGGELDARTAPQVTSFFQEKVASHSTQIVVNLKGLEYSSSAGIRVFLGMAREMRNKGGDLRIAEVDPRVDKVFRLSKFDKIVKIFPAVEDAVNSFQSDSK
jgi:anti-sigma B factor antagonist